MNQTLKQLDLLRELAKVGVDNSMMKLTTRKLLEYEIQQHEASLEKFAQDLAEFEEKYQMRSELFFKKFEKGELGDAMDFVEWAGLHQMFKRIESRKKMLTQGI